MRKSRVISGACATVALVALGNGAAVGAASFSGAEHFSFVSTSNAANADTFSAILTGAFTDGGTAVLPGKGRGTITLREGTIYAHPTSKSKPTQSFDKKNCAYSFRQTGSVVLTGGTGAYAGIAGHGTYTSSGVGVGPFSHGKCNMKAAAVASQFSITGTLTLS